MTQPEPTAPTLRAVAKEAGVSIATASRVLHNSVTVSDDARNRVLNAVAQMNYLPLRKIKPCRCACHADAELMAPVVAAAIARHCAATGQDQFRFKQALEDLRVAIEAYEEATRDPRP